MQHNVAAVVEETIFKQGSKTYFWSSIFFPKQVRRDVQRLYSFVRVADDYVDSKPARKKEFYDLKEAWDKAYRDSRFDVTPRGDDTVNSRIVKNMVYVARTYGFDPAWIEAFFVSMESDLEGKQYLGWDDTLAYMYGSAEVIGLMMCRIIGVSQAGHQSARMLGRAMQQINFIRDIDEDITLGRCYFPESELGKYELKTLDKPSGDHAAFDAFVRAEIVRYREWMEEAEKGYKYLPVRLLPAIKTASDMYGWTAEQIYKDPMLVFSKKLKPPRNRIVYTGLKNILRR